MTIYDASSAGIELMHKLREGRFNLASCDDMCFAHGVAREWVVNAGLFQRVRFTCTVRKQDAAKLHARLDEDLETG